MRNLIRHKAFSAINIAGLALGMTCCLFIFLWVQDETRIDNFHEKGETLYNIYETVTSKKQTSGSYSTPVRFSDGQPNILVDDIKQSVPEVEHINFYATSYELPWGHPETFQVDDKLHKLEGARASEDFFLMFDYPLIAGDAKKCLHGISSLAISQKMAEMFFGTPQNAIGKSIRYENRIDFIVTAVFENVTSRSTLKFDYLINWESHLTRLAWASAKILTTIQVAKNANIKDVENKINRIVKTRLGKDEDLQTTLGLQPYSDQYLVANFVNGKPGGGRIEYVRIFTGVAIFVLFIACINFMNLATARSIKRAKEVGVRKVVGSSRTNLIRQFFGESLLLSILALTLSLIAMQLLLPAFNAFTGKHIHSPITDSLFWYISIGLVVFTGFVAGSYPALFLSSLKPVKILKGTIRFTGASILFRKSLVVFQFSLSIILLIATIVVSRQTNYVQHTHLGYDRENLIYIRIEGELNLKNKYLAFKEQASKMPGIAMIDRSSEAPHAMAFTVTDPIQWEGKNEQAAVGFNPTSVGYDFIKLMNLKIIEGRDFSNSHSTDSAAFMINEKALKEMGLKDPIGKWISAWGKKGHIIAVLKDYHTHSLHDPITPLIVDVKEDLDFGVIIVRTEAGRTEAALSSLKKVYEDINPNYPFAYQFLDQEFDKLYGTEQVITKLSNVFAVLAILISCLGLLGLVMFAAEQRTKEIGIRKVLGATVSNIITLLSIDFFKIVFISFFIAAPLAYYYMNQWLNGFAFKTELSWWIFALSGGAALLIAALTISVQAIQSALVNPTKSLKSE